MNEELYYKDYVMGKMQLIKESEKSDDKKE